MIVKAWYHWCQGMDSEMVEEAGCKSVTQFYNSPISFKMKWILLRDILREELNVKFSPGERLTIDDFSSPIKYTAY